jgi:small ligand-binding sensory domain FIST
MMNADGGGPILSQAIERGFMQIASALSTGATVATMVQELREELMREGAGRRVDLLIVFISSSLRQEFEAVTSELRRALRPTHMVAVMAESIIGGAQELERTSAVSAMTLTLSDGAGVRPFHIAEDEWSELLSEPEELKLRLAPESAGQEEDSTRAFIMIADPFTVPIVQLLDACSAVFPHAPVIGGMASGVEKPGDVRMAIDDALYSSGLIGITFFGDIEIDCVVSQGCRPIGKTFTVTKCHKNVIEHLDGEPALPAIEQMVSTLPLHERQLLATGGLQIGRVIDEGKGNYGRGDFLIRSLVGVRRESGAILIGDIVRPGQTLQFHVRDAKTAEEEMRLLLEGETMLASETAPPVAALLFTCNSRGTRFFDMPDHDVSVTRQVLGDIPVAGFFAAGELGPVGQKNFIHGHTASLAIFRRAESGAT